MDFYNPIMKYTKINKRLKNNVSDVFIALKLACSLSINLINSPQNKK